MMVKSRRFGRNCCGRDVVTNDVTNGASRNSVMNGNTNLDAISCGHSVLSTRAIGAAVTPPRHGVTDRRIHYTE
jgi:hypothetical protein